MTAALNRYALRPVPSPQQWSAYHAIRRQAIFAALLPGQGYDEHAPDETAPGNFPHVLLHDGEIIGVARIDLIGQSRWASFGWESDCRDDGISPRHDCKARVPCCRHGCPKSSPIPAFKGSLNCLRLLFR